MNKYHRVMIKTRRTTEPKKGFPLPTVLVLNPRSVYGKENELADIVTEYESSVICLSESWNRPDFPLKSH